MWYLGSLFVVFILIAVFTLAGHLLCALLPTRVRPYAAFAFAPVMGMALFMLVAVFLAWIGNGFRTALCLPLTVIAAMVAQRLDKGGRGLRHALATAAYALPLAGIGMFSLLRFDAFNPYNDTFTYLAHAQWLQEHPFRQPAAVSGLHPVLSEIALYQVHSLRMGASMLLGFLQAVFGLDWSYKIYFAVVMLPVVAAAVGVAGFCLFVTRTRRWLAGLAGAAVATTLNGITFGSQVGFYPQTCGLALLFGALGLLALYMYHGRSRFNLGSFVPAAVLFAALVFCYPEILPFAVLAAVLTVAAGVACGGIAPGTACRAAACVALITLPLVNLEWLRAARSIIAQAGVVVGGGVPWTPFQFVAHASGFLSGAVDGSVWTLRSAQLTEAAAFLAIGGAAAVLLLLRKRLRLVGILMAFAMLLPSVAAFLYFRYAVKTPFPVGVGQSWNEFKLANWVSVFAVFLLAAAAGAAGAYSRKARIAVAGGLLLWQATGIGASWTMADLRTRGIRSETGFDHAPFEAYEQMRRVAAVAGNETIYLDLAEPHVKTREMLAYFLADRKLESNWENDAVLAPSELSPSERNYPLRPDVWCIRPAVVGHLERGEQLVGAIGLLRMPREWFNLVSVNGGYPQEHDSSGSWYWTPHTLAYRFHKVGGGEHPRIGLQFTYLPAGGPRSLEVTSGDGGREHVATFQMKLAWTPVSIPDLQLDSRDFTITFVDKEPPIGLGSDSRKAAFLIKNLRIESKE